MTEDHGQDRIIIDIDRARMVVDLQYQTIPSGHNQAAVLKNRRRPVHPWYRFASPANGPDQSRHTQRFDNADATDIEF